MADIQLLQTRKISERVPGANTADVGGATAQAIQNIGGKLETFATDLAMKRKGVEVNKYVNESKISFERDFSAMVAEQRKQWGDDHKGFTEYVEATGRDMKQKYLDDAPYQDAKDAFDLDSTNTIGNTLIKQDSEIRSEVDAKAKDTKKKLFIHQAQKFQSDPMSITRDVDFHSTMEEMNDPNLFTPQEIMENQNSARKTMRDGTLNGFISKAKEMGTNGQMVKERDFYKKGMDFLRSGDPMLADMGPDDMLAYETQFEQGLKQAKERSSLHTRERVNAFISSGGQDPILYNDIRNRILSDPNLDNFEKENAISKVTSQHAYGQVANIIGLVPPQERDLNKVINQTVDGMGLKDPYIKSAATAELKKDIGEKVAADDKEFLRDVGGYFEKRDPVVASLAVQSVSGSPQAFEQLKRELDSHYDRFKVNDGLRSYTTPAMRTHFKKYFEGSLENKEYSSATKALDDIVNMAGPDTYRVMKESGINPKYAVVGIVGDELTRKRMLENMASYNKDSPALKAIGEKKVNEVREEWNNTRLIKAIRASGTTASKELADAMVDQMEYDYASRVSSGGKSSDSQEKAMSIFGRFYDTSKISRSTVYFPSGDDVLKSSVTQFVDGFSDEDIDYIGALGLKVEGDKNIINSEIRDRGTWVNTSPNKLELQVRDGTGILRTLERADGRPASWTTDEIKAFPITKVLSEQRKAKNAQALGPNMLAQARRGDAINKAEISKFFTNLFGGGQ